MYCSHSWQILVTHLSMSFPLEALVDGIGWIKEEDDRRSRSWTLLPPALLLSSPRFAG